ncbi:MAG: flagellar hook-associated protein FlgK [Bdellovibrionota bacterium]
MGMAGVFKTGQSGMNVARAAIATTGHNISNANREGFSRQRVQSAPNETRTAAGSHGYVGSGAIISRIERVNDQYIEKQLRNGAKDLAHFEEKDLVLGQVEDVFNEMHGDGLNRLIATFFNEFRRLSNEPDNEAVRQSVREASQALVGDFHRLRKEVEEVRRHIDARLENYTTEINAISDEIKELNLKINILENSGAPANDLSDKRDVALKKLATYMNLNTHKDNNNNTIVEISGVGPLVTGGRSEKFSTARSPKDDQGKQEGSLDLVSTSSVQAVVTHQIKGGKLGALLEIRDQTLSTIVDRLDDLAYALTNTVNEIHIQGFTRNGLTNVEFFKPISKERAAEFLELSDAVRDNVNNIAAAAMPEAPGDNRIALVISGLQNMRLMNEGNATMDDWYNSIVSDVGVAAAKTKFGLNQQRDIITQLNRMRDQISGVSIDEETANLMQFQHAFDASAKVIQVADEMLKTVLELKR